MNYPKISIITPSFNQGPFLEQTILSVLNQHYPNLEYIIIDGGSSDKSLEVIKKYDHCLAYWVSEPDNGQSHAINKGMAIASGDWVGWLNSDDYLLPDALISIIRVANNHPETDWIIGSTVIVNSEGMEQSVIAPRCSNGPWYDFVDVRRSKTDIPQPSSFWTRTASLVAGSLDESLTYAMDHEYWGRLAYNGYRPLCIDSKLTAFRVHQSSKTSEGLIPFWREEVKIVDKWLQIARPEEMHILLGCKLFLRRGIWRMRARNTIARIIENLQSKMKA